MTLLLHTALAGLLVAVLVLAVRSTILRWYGRPKRTQPRKPRG